MIPFGATCKTCFWFQGLNYSGRDECGCCVRYPPTPKPHGATEQNMLPPKAQRWKTNAGVYPGVAHHNRCGEWQPDIVYACDITRGKDYTEIHDELRQTKYKLERRDATIKKLRAEVRKFKRRKGDSDANDRTDSGGDPAGQGPGGTAETDGSP